MLGLCMLWLQIQLQRWPCVLIRQQHTHAAAILSSSSPGPLPETLLACLVTCTPNLASSCYCLPQNSCSWLVLEVIPR